MASTSPENTVQGDKKTSIWLKTSTWSDSLVYVYNMNILFKYIYTKIQGKITLESLKWFVCPNQNNNYMYMYNCTCRDIYIIHKLNFSWIVEK